MTGVTVYIEKWRDSVSALRLQRAIETLVGSLRAKENQRGGGGAFGGASASCGSVHPSVNFIVQHSAREQTLVSLCIWYSKQM